MKLVVTGISGFVGQNLNNYFKDEDVIGVSRTVGENSVSYDQFSEALNDAEAVVHLAGKAHDLKKTSDDSEYFKVNTELTKSLFDQFLGSNCKVFIYMSSVKAAADTVEEGVLTEEVKANPITPYGQSKIQAEEYILSKKLPEDKAVYILRPCMIHGPGNKGNLNLLYQFVAKGIPYPFGAFENKRSFLTVENLCFVIKQLIEKSPVSGVYNVADDKELSTNELVAVIASSIEKKDKIWRLPKGLINFVAKIGDVLRLPINSERVGKLTENYVVSNNKIKKAIGVDFPVSSVNGLTKTIKSFNQ